MASFCRLLTLQLVSERVARESGDHALKEVMIMEVERRHILQAWERRRRWWQEKLVLGLGDTHPELAERIHEWTAIEAYSEEDAASDRAAGYPVELHP